MTKMFDPSTAFFPDAGQPLHRPPAFELEFWVDSQAPEFEGLVSEVAERMELAAPVQRRSKSRRQVLRLVLCNLVQNHYRMPGRPTRYRRSPKAYAGNSRYRPTFVSGRVLAGVVDALSAAGLVFHKRGIWDALGAHGNTASLVAAKAGLVSSWEARGVNRAMVRYSADRPTVELRSPKKRRLGGGKFFDLVEPPATEIPAGAVIEQLMTNVRTVNQHLSAFKLAVPEEALQVGSTDGPNWVLDDDRWRDNENPAPSFYIDAHDTFLVRKFNDVRPPEYGLDRGGRFDGGWWQRIKRESRQLITIDGEPTVELDYKSFHPRMIYHRANIDRPGDLYSLPVLEEVAEGFDAAKLRKAVKRIWLVLINSTARQLGARRRENRGDLLKRWEIELPDTLHPMVVADMIRGAHPDVAGTFGKGVGLELQAIDSAICQGILLEGCKAGMPILPIHDSFVVRQKDEDRLWWMMVRHYRDRLWFEPEIEKKGPSAVGKSVSVGFEFNEVATNSLPWGAEADTPDWPFH
jgi:hypothetical protein